MEWTQKLLENIQREIVWQEQFGKIFGMTSKTIGVEQKNGVWRGDQVVRAATACQS